MKRYGIALTLILLVSSASATFADVNDSGGVDAASADVFYVDKDNGSGIEDGRSWQTAFTEIQDGIDLAHLSVEMQKGIGSASGNSELWVAEGIYNEERVSMMHDPPVDTGSLIMKEGVHLYGGFKGNEIARDERDWVAHLTIISGLSASKVYASHVVVGADGSILDGFTIRGGYANFPQGRDTDEVSGGGMFNKNASPTIRNCTFSENIAIEGGGMYNENSMPTIMSCIFTHNQSWHDGGAMQNQNSTPTIINCIFSHNDVAKWYGSAIANFNRSSAFVSNCTFWNNSGCLFGPNTICIDQNSALQVINSIFWNERYSRPDLTPHLPDSGDTVYVAYSDVQGGYEGRGNIDADPLFINPERGNFHLQRESPCIDAGAYLDDGLLPNDFEGHARGYNGVSEPRGDGSDYDIGAYEFVNPCDVNCDGSVNALDVELVIDAILRVDIVSIAPTGNGDVNYDSIADAVDVQLVINAALAIT